MALKQMKDKVDTDFYESAASYLGDKKVEDEAPAQEEEAPTVEGDQESEASQPEQ